MNRTRTGKKNTSFITAIVLMAILVMLWIIQQGLSKSGLPPQLAGLLNGDFENFRNLEQFSEEKSDSVQKQIAGFWVFSEGDAQSDPVVKKEYMEIINNGIIWHVREWFLNDPSGGRHTLTNVVQGYVRPYSYSQDGSVYYCEARTIRQIFIVGQDTCYGQSHHDEIWEVNMKDSLLTVNRREYVPYRGELRAFFPDGDQLDIVDKVTLGNCAAAADLSFYAKKLLARSFVPLPALSRTKSVESLIQTYYKPVVFDELVRRYDPNAVPDDMDLQFTLTHEGVVTNLKNRSAKIVTKRFDDLAAIDIGGWLFPPAADQKEPQRIELTVKVR